MRTRVVVVMHRVEQPKTSNTGRLLLGVLENAAFSVRGVRDGPASCPTGRRMVLFPSADSRALSAEDAHHEPPTTLVVPDGTWAQAHRIARRDPWALGAEHVHLPNPPPSRYTLRRSPRAGMLCTYEATAYALSLLEGRDVCELMLPVLDEFVRRVATMRSGAAPTLTSGRPALVRS